MKNNTYKINIIDDLNEIEKYREEWNNFRKKYADFDINADIDHYVEVIKNKTNLIKPYVFLLLHEETPIAMLIGRIESVPLNCKIGYKIIFKPIVNCLSIIYGGLMFQDNDEIGSIFLNKIRETLKNRFIDIVSFHMVKEDSVFFKLIRDSSSFIYHDFFPEKEVHWKININDMENPVRSTISKNENKKNRNRLKKLINDHGNIDFTLYDKEGDVEQLLKDCELIAKQTYQRGMDVGFSNDPLMRSRLLLAARKNWLRSYTININKVPCAYQLGFIYNNVYYAMGRGYNQDFKYYAVGTILFFHALEEASESRQIQCWDYGFGDAVHKKIFGNESFSEVSVKIFSSGLFGFYLNTIWTVTKIIDRGIRFILKKIDVQNIKTMWRNLIRKNNTQ